jgi:hypothetical protein
MTPVACSCMVRIPSGAVVVATVVATVVEDGS